MCHLRSTVISRNLHSTFMGWDIGTGEFKRQMICDIPVADSAFHGFECWGDDKVCDRINSQHFFMLLQWFRLYMVSWPAIQAHVCA